MKRQLSFAAGSAVELSLLLVAAGAAWALKAPLFADLHWSVRDLFLGIAATAPLLFGFVLLMKATLPALRRIQAFLETGIRPAMRHWTVPQVAVISLLAGLCEETLFRGVLQGAFTEWLGQGPALVVAAAVFGVCHWITRTYALLAALVGLYLGGLWLWTGNLLVPIVAHALYDFVALIWILRRREA
jgi:uncharacterized protein